MQDSRAAPPVEPTQKIKEARDIPEKRTVVVPHEDGSWGVDTVELRNSSEVKELYMLINSAS